MASVIKSFISSGDGGVFHLIWAAWQGTYMHVWRTCFLREVTFTMRRGTENWAKFTHSLLNFSKKVSNITTVYNSTKFPTWDTTMTRHEKPLGYWWRILSHIMYSSDILGSSRIVCMQYMFQMTHKNTKHNNKYISIYSIRQNNLFHEIQGLHVQNVPFALKQNVLHVLTVYI